MIKFLSSKKTILVVFLVFLVAIVLFNYFDLTFDFNSFRQYNHSEIESIDYQHVNINTANLQTLSDLPYVSDSQAKAIIEHRREHGNFESIEEIMQVEGIGEKTFLRIKLNITT